MRPVAFCLLEHDNRLLLQEFWHEHENYTFYRPPGGGIEHGERAAEAMRRELREELDARVSEPEFITVLENIFDYGGVTKHEIVFLYRATVLDARVTAATEVILTDELPQRAVWVPLQRLQADDFILYPSELKARLRELYPTL